MLRHAEISPAEEVGDTSNIKTFLPDRVRAGFSLPKLFATDLSGRLADEPKLTWGGQASAEELADHRYVYP